MNAVKEEVVLTKRTAEKGGFIIKSLPEGVYKVTIKKHGYREQVVTVAVTDGEIGDLNVELSETKKRSPAKVGLLDKNKIVKMILAY